MPPSVSVLMPVFNASRYLSQAIASIRAQTFDDFEFVIVDDGSTDDSAAILARSAATDPRIRLISRQRGGIVAALNDGLAACRAPLVARMDADDVASPSRLEHQVNYLRAHPSCVAVGSRVLLVDPDDLPIRIWVDELAHDEIDHAHLACRWPMVHPTVMMRRQAVEKVGGYRARYETLEDVDLFLRLAEVGRLANLAEVLLRYRQHFASICHRRSGEQAAIRRVLIEEACRRRGIAMEFAIPKPMAASESNRHRLWAWWALSSGHTRTARKHALRAMLRMPLSAESWRLGYCALRGR